MRPITSTTNVRWWLAAVETRASTASTTRCSAVSAPIVMSVPAMSLSIDPTRPTRASGAAAFAVSGGDLALCRELLQEAGPLPAEEVGPRQRAVSADDDQRVDPLARHVPGGGEPPLARPERRAARRADDGAPFREDAADVVPPHPPDPRPAVDEPLEPLLHREDLEPLLQRRADRRPDDGVHPGGVAAARQDRHAPGSLARHAALLRVRVQAPGTPGILGAGALRRGPRGSLRLHASGTGSSGFGSPSENPWRELDSELPEDRRPTRGSRPARRSSPCRGCGPPCRSP